jgi:AcrR family transcriptional regulator
MARDTYRGTSNNKERSKEKLIEAVGTIIKTSGYTALNQANISKVSGVDRKLIKLYFGSLEALIETYVRGKDYWVDAAGNAGSLMTELSYENLQSTMESVLTHQFDYFYQNEEMQKIVLWQLSERSKIMHEVTEEREKIGAAFFDLAEPFFKGSDVDIRAIAGLLVCGIYYMVLHAKSSDSLICGLDITTEEGSNRIKNAMHHIIAEAFKRKSISH